MIAGNWKMYKTIADTRAFFAAFSPLVADANHCDIVVAPPFTAISAAVEAATTAQTRLFPTPNSPISAPTLSIPLKTSLVALRILAVSNL